ncbi:MAG: hypothetical protein ACRDIY_04085 [Chloroflexota bacterium]
MRVKLILLSLALGLLLAGCGGRGQTAAQPTAPAHPAAAVSIVATPTPTGPGVNALLKSSGEPAATPRPSPARASGGGLSCLNHRMRSLQRGNLLPTSLCS